MSGKHYKGPEVSCCIKYFIFGFNVIFWFLGIAFLGIGLWAWNEKGVLSNISSITDLGGFDPVWLFLVVGGVMFILGFAGCIGALRENTFLLKFFSVFLGIIFFLELTAGVLAFVFKDWIKDQLYFFINNNIRAYRDDIDLQNLIDFTQEYIPMQVESDAACHSPAVLKIPRKMSSTLSVAMMPGRNQFLGYAWPRIWLVILKLSGLAGRAPATAVQDTGQTQAFLTLSCAELMSKLRGPQSQRHPSTPPDGAIKTLFLGGE
ncbi:tetraspanin-5 isoform X4 [Trichechus manatus latirostris]|uniref:Tetraspanin-5 isoform X4 n=1 Tax=Trichechus manatus latirostris TaxID=127582 RepID=A0A2Y9QCQ1_TRIMA|nr:tetraspanin-5 isoform X4 [Trichechus manatus latirostris]